MNRALALFVCLSLVGPLPASAVSSGPKLPGRITTLSLPVDPALPQAIASLKADPASGALGIRVAETWNAAAFLLKGAAPASGETVAGLMRQAELRIQAQAVLDAWKAAPAPAAPAASGAGEALRALGGLIAALDSARADLAESQKSLEAAFEMAARRIQLDRVPAPPADVFKPMNSAQKAAFLQRYVAHLRARDGVPDTLNKRFSVRERFFEELGRDPVVRSGPAVDAAAYVRSEPLDAPEPALAAKAAGLEAQRTLWALMMGKANRGEAYAVGQLMKRSEYKKPRADDPMTWIAIEEFYHTRILKDALKVLGLDMRELAPPPVVKALSFLMARLPKFVSHTFVMASEVIGVAVFRLLRDKARALFQDDPKSLARIDALLQQIIVDEVGHVHFVRSQLGPVRLWIAKKLVPIALGALMARGSEAELLFGRKALIAAAKAADIDGAAAEYPDRFVAFP